jgi:hypothetical protein
MWFRRFAIVIALSLVTACGSTTSGIKAPPKFQSDTYSGLALNARRLEIVENWQMPMQAPYIGHFLTPYPSNLIAQWAASVLQPAGGSGELILDISKAAVTREKLPRKTDLQGILTDQQDTRIRVEIAARLMWIQPVGGAKALINLSAVQSTTVPESSTANAFDIAVNETLLAALAALDAQARKELAKIDNIVLP